jgi:hypothetical protein
MRSVSADAGDAAVAAGLVAELVVDLHAPPLGDRDRAQSRSRSSVTRQD